MPKSAPWFLYLLLCSDNSIYTGITNNVKKRIVQHNAGKGAKYTRGRGPVKLLKKFKFKNKSEAAKAEWAVKQLPKNKKLGLKKLSSNHEFIRKFERTNRRRVRRGADQL